MKVLIVTGIYPPDMGGPASHAAMLAEELSCRGHTVSVLSLWEGTSFTAQEDRIKVPRVWPPARRLLSIVRWVIAKRHRYEVIYAAGLHVEAVLAARMARIPVVIKIVADPAWERAIRRGIASVGVQEFQLSRAGGVRLRALRWLRNWPVRSADCVTVPSIYLRQMVEGWVRDEAGDILVIRNGVRRPAVRKQARPRNGALRLLFVGRLAPVKRLDVLVDAVSRCPNATLEIVGEGPDQNRLMERIELLEVADRVRLLGGQTPDEVVRSMEVADFLVLTSETEGLPHVVLEALAVGIPVVAPNVGGLSEAIRDGQNGLLVEPPSVAGFSRVFKRLSEDYEQVQSLTFGALASSSEWLFDRTADQVEEVLDRVVRPRPGIVFVGKTRFARELGAGLRRKFRMFTEFFDPVVIGTGRPRVRKIEGVTVYCFPALRPPLVGGLLFYLGGPLIAMVVTLKRGSDAVVCQSPFEAFGTLLLRRVIPRSLRPRVVVEVHGEWRIASRMYGSPIRRMLAPLSDSVACWTLRRGDRVRVVGSHLEDMVRAIGFRGEVDRFVTFSDFGAFLDEPVQPMPSLPRAVFVGTLQKTKGLDVLLDAWSIVCSEMRNAELLVVGDGPLRPDTERKAARLGLSRNVTFMGPLTPTKVREAIDSACVLLLPSRSEGFGRVVLEAMARGRPVVGSRVGGIPESVVHGDNGYLVPVGDHVEFARAILKLFNDYELRNRMAHAARETAVARNLDEEYEAGIARLAEWVKQRGAQHKTE